MNLKRIGIFFAATFLLTACHRQDTKLEEQIIGTWTNSNGDYEITFHANKHLYSMVRNKDRTDIHFFDGRWQIKTGILAMIFSTNNFKTTQTFSLPFQLTNDELSYHQLGTNEGYEPFTVKLKRK